jgi:hypothetical protein
LQGQFTFEGAASECLGDVLDCGSEAVHFVFPFALK